MIVSPSSASSLVKRIYEISARAKQLKTLLPVSTKIVDYELNGLMVSEVILGEKRSE